MILAIASLLSLSNVRVSLSNPARIPNEVIDATLKDACLSGCSEEQVVAHRRSMKSEMHDLNQDRIEELFVYIGHPDFCGMGFKLQFLDLSTETEWLSFAPEGLSCGESWCSDDKRI